MQEEIRVKPKYGKTYQTLLITSIRNAGNIHYQHRGNDSKIEELKKENDKLRAVGRLHIGQVVYACRTNSLYIGEITKIIHTSIRSRIELNDDEEFLQSEIYSTKDEALKQLKI